MFNKPKLLVDEEMMMYGPLSRNLLIVIFNLTLIQLILWFARYTRNGYIEALLMGLFLLVTGLSIRMYASVNSLPLDDTLLQCAVYFGVSHIAYFLAAPKHDTHSDNTKT